MKNLKKYYFISFLFFLIIVGGLFILSDSVCAIEAETTDGARFGSNFTTDFADSRGIIESDGSDTKIDIILIVLLLLLISSLVFFIISLVRLIAYRNDKEINKKAVTLVILSFLAFILLLFIFLIYNNLESFYEALQITN